MITNARRHPPRRVNRGTKARSWPRNPASGFSLIELLMAIFILGIGVISIAALLPAGIAQQQQSVDDVMGPIVANSALSIIRSKVESEDFGDFEQFSSAGTPLRAPRYTIDGDWNWLRPGFYFNDLPGTPLVNERGAVNIFSSDSAIDATEFPGGIGIGLTGIPFSLTRYPSGPPQILITQGERYYPQQSAHAVTPGRPPAPQYVWDCMFRRFQGRIIVTIFVYRAKLAAGETGSYFVQPDLSSPGIPPLPVWVDLSNGGADVNLGWDAAGPDGTFGTADDAFVVGTQPCADFDLTQIPQGWQAPGQWLLDQNNNIHQVLSAECDQASSAMAIQLVRPVPGLPPTAVYYSLPPADGVTNIVRDIWYIPPYPPAGVDGPRLTPVFVTVKEL